MLKSAVFQFGNRIYGLRTRKRPNLTVEDKCCRHDTMEIRHGKLLLLQNILKRQKEYQQLQSKKADTAIINI